jgi:nucleotide-binding universal stress UspA family protein
MLPAPLNILAALDGTRHDQHLIRQMKAWLQCFPQAHLHFLHVKQASPLPPKLKEAHPALAETTPTKKTARETLAHHWPDGPYQFHEREGAAFTEIIQLVQEEEIQLLLLGLKHQRDGSGLINHRLANQSPCSLLLVPAYLPDRMAKILAATDFSAHAEEALSWGQEWAQCQGAQLEAVHFFHLPGGYLKNAGGQQELATLIRQHSEAEKQAAGPLHAQTPCRFRPNRGHPERELLDHATEVQADLLILGSKGKTAATALLMGSFAEKVFLYNRSQALLVVKQPGENTGLWKSILSAG